MIIWVRLQWLIVHEKHLSTKVSGSCDYSDVPVGGVPTEAFMVRFL